jgi:phosphodiesterase/alkaline phosphatase D-like protein
MKKQIIPLLLLFTGIAANAQYVTHGPVVGAVSSSTARMYIRTSEAAEVKIQLATDTSFTTVNEVTDSTFAWRDSSNILSFTGLSAYTTYYYRFFVNGQPDTISGYFRTFPATGVKGNYKWGVLSCQEYGTYNAFNALYNRHPELVLHTGDWTYPDYQIPGDHRMDWSLQQLSYRKRYKEQYMEKTLRSAVYDYVPDNHDGAGQRDNIIGTAYYVDTAGKVRNYYNVEPVPAGAVANVFKGYYEYFPGYSIPHPTNGMYHSYRYGNAEVFFLDLRHCGNGQDSTFLYDSLQNKWIFDPRPGQTLLGDTQFNWLKNSLAQSTADWKFIVSQLMFNRNFRKVVQVSLALQNLIFNLGGQGGTGFRMADAMASNWCGYPREQDGLLDFLKLNNIKDVIVLSGHVHTNVMDNGFNAGLPELNTGPAAGTGAELTYYVDSVMQLLNQGTAIDSLWNGGGQGVENTNFKSGFGMVEIFNSDSVVMQIVDEDNATVSSMTILHSSIAPSSVVDLPLKACVVEKIYPNISSNWVQVAYCTDYTPQASDRAYLIDLSGRALSIPVSAHGFSVKGVPAGHYLFVNDYGPS